MQAPDWQCRSGSTRTDEGNDTMPHKVRQLPRARQDRRSFVLGYWADESVPQIDDLLCPHGIDAQAFAHWLGPLLSNHRGALAVAEQMPSANAERDFLERLTSAVSDVEAMLTSSSEPPIAAAHLHTKATRVGTEWASLRDRVRNDLRALRLIALAARQGLPPAKSGRRKTASPRDQLAAQVVSQIQAVAPMKKTAALQLAREILERCGVHGLGDVKRSVRRGQQSP